MMSSRVTRPLCLLVAGAIAVTAQETVSGTLKIAVLEGKNAVNSIQLGRSVAPIVEVRDQNEFPVEGATVVFTLPESGPGGIFPEKKTSFTARTDLQGQASAPFLVNGLPGRFEIHVTATAGARKGEASIEQTNSMGGYIGPAPPKRHWYMKWYTWAIVGAIGAGTAIALTRGGGSSAPPSITITPGGPVFGVPH